jgi:hypothetical protein
MRDMNAGRGIPDIFADIMDAFTTLIRKEMQLARTEISDKISSVGIALGMVALGGVLGLAALLLLLRAIVAMLIAAGLGPTVATLIVAAGSLIVGIAVIYAGLKRLQAGSLVPERTIGQLHRDAAVAKDQLHFSPKHSESTP